MSAEANIVDWSETRRMAAEIIAYGHRILSAIEKNGSPFPSRDEVGLLKVKIIRGIVAAKYGFDADDFIKRDRRAPLAWARMVAMALCRELAQCPDRLVELDFKRTHGCLDNAIEAVKARSDCEQEFRDDLQELRQLISQSELFKS